MSEIEELRIAVEANEKDIDDLEKTVQALSVFPVSIGSWAVFTADGVPGTRFRLEPYDQGRTAPTEEQRELYRRAG